MEYQHTFKRLVVWQKAMSLVTNIYKNIKSFPKEELYGLSSQIKRSAISIPSNIAEGYGRKGNRDYLRFLNMSLSSLFELQTQLEIAKNLTFLTEDCFGKIYEDTREVERMLTSFIDTVQKR